MKILAATVVAVLAVGQSALAQSCPATPLPGCLTPQKSALLIVDGPRESKRQLRWKWQSPALLLQADFGDPAATTTYAACVYDDVEGVSTLVIELEVPVGDAWIDKDPGGWLYKDKQGAVDGVTKVALVTGRHGRAKVFLRARGETLALPGPFILFEQYLAQDPSVVVQLIGSDIAICWEAVYATSKRNDGFEIKSRTP